jgi:hypothetical protein
VTTSAPRQDVPSEVEPGSLDDLVADAAEVTRHLESVPGPRRVLLIPERARRVVADLDSYGD